MSPAPFTARVGTEPGGPVVALAGELDLTGADVVTAALDAVLAGTPATVWVDCADLTFIDSAGLACLVRAARRTRLVLRRPRTPVRVAVDAAGLAQVLALEP